MCVSMLFKRTEMMEMTEMSVKCEGSVKFSRLFFIRSIFFGKKMQGVAQQDPVPFVPVWSLKKSF